MTTEPRTASGRARTSPSSSPITTRAGSAGKSRPISSSVRHSPARPAGELAYHSAGTSSQEELLQLKSHYARYEADAKARTVALQDSVKHKRKAWIALKQEHAELSAQLAAKGGPGGSVGKSMADITIEQLGKDVHDMRRQYDKIIQEKRTVVAKLQNLQDALQQVQGSSAVSSRPASAGSAASQDASALRQIENRLDKALLKVNEAQSIRRTYEQVLAKLKEEQQLFDPAIKAADEALKTKTAEHTQALQAHREAQQLKEAAKQELAAIEQQLAKDRAARAAKLEAGRAATHTLTQANQALLQKQFQSTATAGITAAASVSTAGSNSIPTTKTVVPTTPNGAVTAVTKAEPLQLVGNKITQGSSSSSTSSDAKEHDHKRVATPQQAVAALCAALSCAQPQALCDRLMTQQETLGSLQAMQQAATHQVGMLANQLDEAKRCLHNNVVGARHGLTQVAIDAEQAALNESLAEADAAKLSHDMVLKVYVDVRSGLDHLSSMLAPLPLPPGHVATALTDETLGDVLAQCQQRLQACLALINSIPKAAALLQGMMDNPDLCFNNVSQTLQ